MRGRHLSNAAVVLIDADRLRHQPPRDNRAASILARLFGFSYSMAYSESVVVSHKAAGPVTGTEKETEK